MLTCKRDLKALDIDVDSWETLASDRVAWKRTLKSQLPIGEAKWKEKCAEKRARRKANAAANEVPQPASPFICPNCARDCKARIGLFSHLRRCTS